LKLHKFQQKGSIFGTFTPKFKTKDAALGLVELHAYSIVYFYFITALNHRKPNLHCQTAESYCKELVHKKLEK
jgi:hypothetical protein